MGHPRAQDLSKKLSQALALQRRLLTEVRFSGPSLGVAADNNCFLKVIDIHFDGRTVDVQGECYSRSEYEAVVGELHPQGENTIRVYLTSDYYCPHMPLDESPSIKNFDLTSCQDRFSPRSIDEYGPFHLPTLRQMWDEEALPRWYYAKASTWHADMGSLSCPLIDRDRIWKGFPFENSHLSWTMDHRRSSENKLSLICYANKAYTVPSRTVPANGPGCMPCANGSWRWLKTFDIAWTKRRTSLSCTNSSPSQMVQLLMLDILDVTLQMNDRTLDMTSNSLERLTAPYTKRDLIEHGIVERLGASIQFIRGIENTINYISEAIELVSTNLRLSSQGATSAHTEDNTPLDTLLNRVQQDCSFYRNHGSRLRETHIEAQEIHLKLVSVNQADSLKRLTLLAAFFLPLSLAAGVLSMQTRFSDLNLLLYDFVGVVIILASIAAFLAALSRWGPLVYDRIIGRTYDWWMLYEAPLLKKVLKFTPLALWWLALLVSFLVGMIKDVILGLKILGYEAAGIVVLWLLFFKRSTDCVRLLPTTPYINSETGVIPAIEATDMISCGSVLRKSVVAD